MATITPFPSKQPAAAQTIASELDAFLADLQETMIQSSISPLAKSITAR